MEKLSKFLVQAKEIVTITNDKLYKRCRVQLHNKGIVLRDEVLGGEIKTKSQQVCNPRQLLVAEIDAKVGGYGIVPPELDGAIVSNHYYLFDIDESIIDLSYFSHYLKTEYFFNQIKAKGSTNYASIRPIDIMNILIPLPKINVQREISRVIDKVETLRIELGSLQTEVDLLLQKLLDDSFKES
jgi:type I restriction enzyme S subunit